MANESREQRKPETAPPEPTQTRTEHTGPHAGTTTAAPHMHETMHDGHAPSKIATVALVGLGAALLEVELIPGILIGAAAVLMPDLVPKIGRNLRPLTKSVIRAGMTVTERARETMAEAGEHFQDIVAEVKSEHQAAHAQRVAEHPKHV